MVSAVTLAGWDSFVNDRNAVNSDSTGCMCNGGVREISGKSFLVKK